MPTLGAFVAAAAVVLPLKPDVAEAVAARGWTARHGVSAPVCRAIRLPLNDDLYQTKSFILGTTDFGPLDLVAIDLHVPQVDGLFGYNFFQDHVICFDGPRSEITIAD